MCDAMKQKATGDLEPDPKSVGCGGNYADASVHVHTTLDITSRFVTNKCLLLHPGILNTRGSTVAPWLIQPLHTSRGVQFSPVLSL